MKKIISMGIASAVLALTSVAAFAENPTGAYLKAEKVDGDYVTGESVSFAIKATQDGVEDGELVVEYTGLEFAGKSGVGAQYSDETKKVAFSNEEGFKTGDAIITLEFKVTAAAGEEVSFKIAGNEGQGYGDIVDTTADTVTGTVGGAGTSSDNSDPNTPNNPNSGIALAVVPAVIAGAAVVVAAKKRK